MTILNPLSADLRQYVIITANYWAFTLTDGALRMLVVLHFHQLGYSPLDIALLFLFYEFFGVVTNLVGGWLGARIGLNHIMQFGLLLQIVALGALLVPEELLTVAWVMAAQALSGIAKDLNKMSAKSSIKLLAKGEHASQLYRWVALLTGSKNTLKGVGFFLGGALLYLNGFHGAIFIMLLGLAAVWLFSLYGLRGNAGKATSKPKFTQIFSNSSAINRLSAARLFLFAARDVWFVVALPVYLSLELGWHHWQVGACLALWVIFYGFIQVLAPRLTAAANYKQAVIWAALLTLVTAVLAWSLSFSAYSIENSAYLLLPGLFIFGAVFAVNSSLHSYLVLFYAREDGVSLDVGFYYMANAMGRLIGTLLSGWLFQMAGLAACLWLAVVMTGLCSIISLALPSQKL